jgi:hypothetical protein
MARVGLSAAGGANSALAEICIERGRRETGSREEI